MGMFDFLTSWGATETRDTCMQKCETKYNVLPTSTPTSEPTSENQPDANTPLYGGSRRRCTKKHRHTRACNKLKGRKVKRGRKSHKKRH